MNTNSTNIILIATCVLAEAAIVGIYYLYCKKSLKKLEEM